MRFVHSYSDLGLVFSGYRLDSSGDFRGLLSLGEVLPAMARCPPHAAPRPGPQRARVAVYVPYICRVQAPHPRSLGGARGPYVGNHRNATGRPP